MRHGWLVAIAMVVAGCASGGPDRAAGPSAIALLKDKDGKEVGVARLSQTAGGVRVALAGRGLPPGEKGVHLHAVGQCQGPDFATAGSHFNPDGKKHGLQSPEGPHAGDLPNLVVSAAGDGTVDYVNPRVTLQAGQPNSLLRDGGTSLVVHAKADDGKTDPAGDSGPRIACGVIVRQ